MAVKYGGSYRSRQLRCDRRRVILGSAAIERKEGEV
jgi:hypothetical protein